MPDALALVLGLHRAIVAAEGAFAHAERVIAERSAQRAGIHALQVAEGADAGGVEVGQRLGPHAPHALDAEGLEPGGERVRRIGCDGQAVRLVHVACQLRHELVGAHAHADGESKLRAGCGADGTRDRGAVAMQEAAAGDVDEGLVHAQCLHQRREATEDVHEAVAEFRVALEAGRRHHGVRAERERTRHGHGAAAAEGARLVAGGRHHAAARAAADEDRLPAQRRVVELLHRREERIEVRVQDGARRGHAATPYRRGGTLGAWFPHSSLPTPSRLRLSPSDARTRW